MEGANGRLAYDGLTLYYKFSSLFQAIARFAPESFDLFESTRGGICLYLDGRKVSPYSTYDYYRLAKTKRIGLIKVIEKIMLEILEPIEKAGLLDSYKKALKEFYLFGLTIFPPDFKERWNDIIQFYYDYAGVSEEEKKIKIELKIKRFRQENEKKGEQ